MEKNKTYRAEIIGYTSDGASVARIHNMVVFVPGGAVGDHCDIRIVKVTKNHAYGRIERIFIASKNRIEPECPQAAQCGGCCFWHITYEEELRAKKQKVMDAMHRIGGIDLEPEEICPSEYITRYRNKAQYPVGRSKDGIVSGFYRVHSHDIIPTDSCLIQTELANSLMVCVRDWMTEYGVLPYDENNGTGLIRHIYIRTGFATGQVLLCLISRSAKVPHADALIAAARRAVPGLCSVMINVNNKPGNTILGTRYNTLWGTNFIEDILCGNRFRISPASFYQVNRAQAERLYDCALAYAALDQTQTALDLYCGVGTITLALARRAKSVIGAEIVAKAVENAKVNAKLNRIDNAEFFCGDAGQTAQILAERGVTPDVIVVDPPRKGLDDITIDTAVLMNPARIVYVSCDPATLARDVKKFSSQGYLIEKYKVFDLFPRTAHVETVVLMSRTNHCKY